jgi:hypothetical protein
MFLLLWMCEPEEKTMLDGRHFMSAWVQFAMAGLALFLTFSVGLQGQSQTLSNGPRRIEITLEKYSDAGWKTVDPGMVFPSGEKVRFRVKSSFNGYLYVVNFSTERKYSLLFPTENTGTSNQIEVDHEYLIPATQGGFQITGPAGHEVVYWLISPVELQQPEQFAKLQYASPSQPSEIEKRPVTLLPRCDDQMFRARGECIDPSAGPQSVNDTKELPEGLSGIDHLTARGLEFSRQQSQAVVSTPEAGSAPIIFEFHLAHR